MVDHQLLVRCVDLAGAQKDHGMKWQVVALLAKEQQVARTGPRNITSYKVKVVPPQRFWGRELGKCAVVQVINAKAAVAHTEQPSTQRRVRILVLTNLTCQRRRRQRNRVR